MEYADVFYCFAAVSGLVLFCGAVKNKTVRNCTYGLFIAGPFLIALVFTLAYGKTYPRCLYRDVPVMAALDWAPAPEGLNIGISRYDDLTTESDIPVYRMLTGESVMTDGALTYEVGTREDGRKIYGIKNGNTDLTVIIPVFAFDNIVVTDNTGTEYTTGRSEDYRITLQVPAGSENTYFVKYHIPVSWRVCDIVSIVTVLLAFILPGRKKVDVAKD
jgi:hypothetical protein